MSCSGEEFYMAVKSTLDKVARNIADDLVLDGEATIGVADLDDTDQTDSVLASPDPAVIYQLLDVGEDPRDPLWLVTFLVGTKTVSDAANFKLSKIQSKISRIFTVGDELDIYQYFSDEAPSDRLAVGTFIANEISPQQFDAQAGIRLAKVSMRVLRL